MLTRMVWNHERRHPEVRHVWASLSNENMIIDSSREESANNEQQGDLTAAAAAKLIELAM